MKKTYKLFSLVLALAMLASVLWAPGVAAKGESLLSNGGYSTDKYSFANCASASKYEKASGIGGKSASDTSTYIVFDTAAGEDIYNNWAWGYSSTVLKTDMANYYIMTCNIYPVSGVTALQLATNSGSRVSGDVTNLEPGQWNRVAWVYEVVESNTSGQVTTYLNGVNVDERTVSGGSFNNLKVSANCFRVRILHESGKKVEFYYDDAGAFSVKKATDESHTLYTAVPKVDDKYLFGDEIVAGTTVDELNTSVSGDADAVITVKAYTDKTLKTPIESGELQPGNMIVLEEASGLSAGTAGSEINYYNYYTVTDKDKIILFDSDSDTIGSGRAAITADVPGDYGKPAEETVWSIYNAGNTNQNDDSANSYLQFNYSSASGKYPLVVECDFLPESNVNAVSFAGNYGVRVSPGIFPQNNPVRGENSNKGSDHDRNPGFVHGRWHKLKMVFDFEKGTGSLYVDGVYNSDYEPASSAAESLKTQTRLIVGWNEVSRVAVEDEKFRIDNIKIYEQINPDPTAERISFDRVTERYLYKDGVLSFFGPFENNKITTAAGELEARAFDSETSYGAQSGKPTEGNLVVVRNAAGSYGYYNVSEHMLAASGSAYVDDTSYRTGELQFVATGAGVLLVAQYDAEGKLVKVDSVSGSGGKLDKTVTPDSQASKVKAMVWDDLNNMQPCVQAMELQSSVAALVIGNSFSKDMTWLLKDIAAADGKNMTVGVLDRGGASAAWHAAKMTAEADNNTWFWLNNSASGHSNLETVLKDYNWDIVVLQNWGDSGEDFYDPNGADYEKNWKEPLVTLAEFVQQNEPDAKIMLHETWAFEQGYKFVTDRSALAQKIRAVNEKAAADVVRETGLTELPLIRSGEAFDKAIAYQEGGVKLFDTTFSGTYQENGLNTKRVFDDREISAEDGSLLLSETDRAAGKTTLHRDGYHASAAGRYLVAANAYAAIFGGTVTGNSFTPGELRLDSSGVVKKTGEEPELQSMTVYLTFDALSAKMVKTLQGIVDEMK